MATGTGLPIPRGQPVTVQPTPQTAKLPSDIVSDAAAWARIEATGNRLASTGEALFEREVHKVDTAAHADIDIGARKTRTEFENRFRDDPAGFENAWRAHTEGVESAVAPRYVPHARLILSREGNAAYSAILNRKSARDDARANESTRVLAGMAEDDVVGAGMAGTLASPDGVAKIDKLRSVLQTRVQAGHLSQEAADFQYNTAISKAEGEVISRDARATYTDALARGEDNPFETARAEAERKLLQNETLRLSPEEKRALLSRTTAELRIADNERRLDLRAARQSATQLREAFGKVAVAKDTVDEVVRQLRAAGGHADAARMLTDWTAATKAAEIARLPLAEATAATRRLAGPRFTPEVGTAIDEAARAEGLDPALLRGIARIESGGRRDVVTGSYKGLFQLSDEQFARHGGGDIFSTADNARAAARKIRAEAATFQQKYGRAPTPTDLYMVHQQGAGGYANHMANPDRPAWQNMLDTGEGRQKGEAWAKRAIWGNVPDDQKARFGSVENVRSRDLVAIYRQKLEGGDKPVEVMAVEDAALLRRVAPQLAERARKEWQQVQAVIAAGGQPSSAQLAGIAEAASAAGDLQTLAQIDARLDTLAAAEEGEKLPVSTGQAVVTEIDRRNQTEGADPERMLLQKWLTRALDENVRGMNDDPVGLIVGRFPERYGAPAPLDAADPEKFAASMRERVRLAGLAEEHFQAPAAALLGPADRAALAKALSSPAQAATAYGALAGLPERFLGPTLKAPDVRAAITGSTRSNDPATVNAAMSFLDGMWRKEPGLVKDAFGEDAIHDLMTWQTLYRYMTPEAMAKERERAALDPQTRERRRALEAQGRTEAAKMDPDKLVSEWSGWFSSARAPGDPLVRDAMMGDYMALYSRRFGETQDKDAAHRQTVDLMRQRWQVSQVNGGRLMQRAPETAYPAVGGSHEWIRAQLEADIAQRLGPRVQFSAAADARVKAWDALLVADRISEGEAQAGKPVSYQVVVTNHLTGKTDVLPRIVFDPSAAQAEFRTRFREERGLIDTEVKARATLDLGTLVGR